MSIADAGLEVRAAAARELIAAREVEPLVGLSLVVWPTGRLAMNEESAPALVAGHISYSAETRAQAVELVASGLSEVEVAERLLGAGRRWRSTVQGFVRAAGRAKIGPLEPNGRCHGCGRRLDSPAKLWCRRRCSDRLALEQIRPTRPRGGVRAAA